MAKNNKRKRKKLGIEEAITVEQSGLDRSRFEPFLEQVSITYEKEIEKILKRDEAILEEEILKGERDKTAEETIQHYSERFEKIKTTIDKLCDNYSEYMDEPVEAYTIEELEDIKHGLLVLLGEGTKNNLDGSKTRSLVLPYEEEVQTLFQKINTEVTKREKNMLKLLDVQFVAQEFVDEDGHYRPEKMHEIINALRTGIYCGFGDEFIEYPYGSKEKKTIQEVYEQIKYV